MIGSISSVRSLRLPLTALAAALALAACGGGDKQAAAPAPAAKPAQPTAAAPAEAPAVPQLTVPELLKAASQAVNEQRLIAPAGNNAMEYYLAVLDKDPKNIQATSALVDIFPISVNVAERAISQKQIDEADRMVKLLDKASPGSYTVTTVRAKLETARAAQTREQAAQLAQQTAQQTAQQQAAAQRTADAQTAAAAARTTPAPAAPAPAPAPSQPEKPVASAPPPPAQTTPPPPPAPEPAAPTGETREATVVRRVPPDFPPDAFRKRIEGWVELEFTVGADGKVGEVTVSKAQPQRVFDKEAIRAMQQWTFQPAMKDGKPVESRLKRRMEFKM